MKIENKKIESILLWLRKELLMLTILAVCLAVSLYSLANLNQVEKEQEMKWSNALKECYTKLGYNSEKEIFYINIDDIDNPNATKYSSVEEGLKDLK